MHMCITTIVYTIIIVFAITGGGFLLGKLNKFGDSDELIDVSKEGKK